MKTLILTSLCLFVLAGCSGKKNNTETSNISTGDSLRGSNRRDNPKMDRVAPKNIKPLVVENIEYSAPTTEMGFLIAKDAATNKELWKKQIYEVKYDEKLEKDVQHVFIDSLWQQGKMIMIQNEDGKIYELNPVSKDVKKIQ